MASGAGIVTVIAHIFMRLIHLGLVMLVTARAGIGRVRVIVDMTQSTLAVGPLMI